MKRTLVALNEAEWQTVEKFRARCGLKSTAAALRWLVCDGLEVFDKAQGVERAPFKLCDCDPRRTCASAFGRPFEGSCRRNQGVDL
ncbi:MAG TPA: hypothetical protein VK630_13410 [Reyranella sp.]|nr:hypothetical protein [Reyranella sp.]